MNHAASRSFFCIVLMASTIGLGCASTPPASASVDGAAVMSSFLAEPTVDAAGPVLSFIKDSPDVFVVFRQTLTPAPVSDDVRMLMMAAFGAGNALAQIRSGKSLDMPLEGVKGMLAVYRRLQAKDPTLAVPQLDAFAGALDDGSLNDKVQAIVAADPR